MAFTISDNAYFSLVCLQYGLPTLLFLVINLACMHQSVGTIGGLDVSDAGFDTENHYHDLEQDMPLVRLGVAPLLAFGVVTLMMAPMMHLLAWGFMMWLAVDRLLVGISIVLMGVCIIALYYAIMFWHTGGWRMTSHIKVLFSFSLGCYFLLAFVLSFLADGVSFFGQSVHFLTLNYILITEVVSQVEKQQQIPAATILKADEYVGGASGAAGLGSTGDRLTKAQKEQKRRDAEKNFFNKFRTDHSLLAPSTEVDSDEELPDMDDDDDSSGGPPENATLIEIHSSRVKVHFNDILHTLIHETQSIQASKEVKYQIKLYFLSLLVLLGYSFAIYKGNGPVSGADSDGGSERYLGFIVSGILVLWDALIYSYATHWNLPISETTKVVMLAGSRVALISFGYQGWFLGVVCLYFAAGVYLVYRIIDRRLPYAAFQLDLGAKECQRFREFAVSLTNPDDTPNPMTGATASNALLQTVSQGGHHGGGIGIAEFVFFIITILFFMAFAVAYETLPPAQSLGTLTQSPWQQWEIGFAVWYVVFLWMMSMWTIRYWMKSEWQISLRATLLTVVTQAFFAFGGWLAFHRTDSIILLVCLICGPMFVLSLIGTYMHCVAVDWHLLAPSYMRNPPNVPFPLAVLTCGLQRDDYRMMGNILLTLASMCAIGLGITFGLGGSSIGWTITFVLFILVTSLIPLIKYLQTLTLDTVDFILLGFWFIAHISLFALTYNVTSNLSDRESFALWGSCVAYPTVLANFLAYHIIMENGGQLTKNTALVLLGTVVIIVIAVIIIFFVVGADVGGMVLGAVVVVLVAGAIALRWTNGNFTLPRELRWVTILAFCVVLVGGIVLGVVVPNDDESFWLFSGSWFLVILFVAVMAYGDKRRLNGGDAKLAHAAFRYAEYIFPVYYYDRRNDTNPVRPANLHMALYCLAFFLFLVWCAACMVTTRVNIGLGFSSLCLVGFYTFLRHRSISANKELMRILPYIGESAVSRAKDTSRELQLSGASMQFEEPKPDVFGLKRWGQIVHEMLQIDLDPVPQLKKKQALLKKKLGLGRSCFCARLRTDAQQLDDHFILLERLNDWSFACSKIHFKIEAHFYFLLLLNAKAEVHVEESAMKAFCQWLRKEKTHPLTGQPVALDPCISNYEMYDSPTRFPQSYILQLQRWKEEYTASLRQTAKDNEVNRQKEAAAEMIRAARMEKKAKAMADRVKQRELAAAAAAAQLKDAAGNSVPPPSTPEDADPVTAEFHRAIAAYKATGKKFEDEDFPANGESVYLDGERTPSKGTAINMQPLDDEWKRPHEILAELAADNPEQVIPRDPKVFVDGFDLTDIVQGSIGTCYFLSAIGCLGIRELANPRKPLLTDIFTMESPTVEYNECGAFLVRFYREGKKVQVLIDDRLPVSQGNYAFSHAKSPNELWVSFLEKAYAKLFSCYEAIEAGLISQALCDLSNGASEQIALKDRNGQVCVNPDQLWIQLEDSFKSGYLVGAGSNTGSDTTEVQGIAQGHAYMVVRVYSDSAQTEKLIQLQNPHGHGEWDGDWSDNSDKWTQWWRNTLKEEIVDDGKFWMSFQDFLQAYQNIYICRLLPVRKSLSSSWHGHTAAGPNEPRHNPTFCVSTPKPCKIWIELEQTNRRGRPTGVSAQEMAAAEAAESQSGPPPQGEYAYIQFFMVENGGQRVDKIVKEQVKGCANKFKMMNDRQISAEVFLDAPDTPFTIVCVTKNKGFETGLTLSIFCSDEAVKFWMLPEEAPNAED